MQVHQVLVGAAAGDAITNEAIGLRDAIRAGFPGASSEIYAQHRQPGLAGILALGEFPAPDPSGTVILFHSSIGEGAVGEFLDRRPERIVVRYHNITPAEFFRPYDAGFAELLALGRRQLFGLRDRALVAIADSEYNRQELVEAGFTETVVVPIHADVAALRAARQVAPRSFPLARGSDEPVVAFVGRIAPNKGHVNLLKALYVLKTYRQYHAHLWVVGGGNLPRYSWELDQYRRELALTDTHFTGTVSFEELAYIYGRATVFLCLSEHEGFCVPLVEAMGFDVPIVALDRAAVPETLGGAGILLPDPDPELVAEAVSAVIEDQALRSDLIARGRRRLAELRPEQAGEGVVAHLRRVLG